MKSLRLLLFLFFLFLISIAASPVQSTSDSAQTRPSTCVVYFTGVGCPHCAKTDPVLLVDLFQKYPDLIVIEYEIYQQRENAPLLYEYDNVYGSGLGIPLVVFSKEEHLVGDTPILQGVEEIIEGRKGNHCSLMDGSSVAFNELDLSSLPGEPKIWAKERVLISSEGEADGALLKELLTAEDISRVLEGREFETVDPQPVALSGGNVEFGHAVKANGWLFEWGFLQEQGESKRIPWGTVGAILLVIASGAGILYLAFRRMGEQT